MPQRITSTDLVYFPVPKVACTSIKVAILQHNDPTLAARIPAPKPIDLPNGRKGRHIHDAYPSRPYRFYNFLRYPGGRWFCVVRDPLKRFLSSYSNRILHHDDLKHSPPEALEAAGLVRQPDLEDFVDRLEAYSSVSNSIHHHTQPMVHYLGTRAQRYDRIFSMRELDQIAGYCTEAGAPITLPHLQAGGPKLAISDLSDRAVEKLKRYYAEDYRCYSDYIDG